MYNAKLIAHVCSHVCIRCPAHLHDTSESQADAACTSSSADLAVKKYHRLHQWYRVKRERKHGRKQAWQHPAHSFWACLCPGAHLGSIGMLHSCGVDESRSCKSVKSPWSALGHTHQ